MALRDQPYIPLYIQDFLTDEKLIECSAKATGVYVRLMCIMHKSEEYGKILLKQKDKQSTNQIENFAIKLGKQMPYSQQEVIDSLGELIVEKVLTIEGDFLVQKRMVKDNLLSLKRAEAGSKGGKFAQAKIKPKGVPNSEIAIENENEIEIDNEIKIVKSKSEIFELLFQDELFISNLSMTHRGKDLKQAFEECYTHHSSGPNPPGEIWQWKQKLNTWLTIKPTIKNGTSKDKRTEHLTGLAKDFAERHGTGIKP